MTVLTYPISEDNERLIAFFKAFTSLEKSRVEDVFRYLYFSDDVADVIHGLTQDGSYSLDASWYNLEESQFGAFELSGKNADILNIDTLEVSKEENGKYRILNDSSVSPDELLSEISVYARVDDIIAREWDKHFGQED